MSEPVPQASGVFLLNKSPEQFRETVDSVTYTLPPNCTRGPVDGTGAPIPMGVDQAQLFCRRHPNEVTIVWEYTLSARGVDKLWLYHTEKKTKSFQYDGRIESIPPFERKPFIKEAAKHAAHTTGSINGGKRVFFFAPAPTKGELLAKASMKDQEIRWLGRYFGLSFPRVMTGQEVAWQINAHVWQKHLDVTADDIPRLVEAGRATMHVDNGKKESSQAA
jgi:hypothetical protein